MVFCTKYQKESEKSVQRLFQKNNVFFHKSSGDHCFSNQKGSGKNQIHLWGLCEGECVLLKWKDGENKEGVLYL